MTKRQNYHNDKKTKREKRHRPIREFNIMTGQFRTLAMFSSQISNRLMLGLNKVAAADDSA